MSCIEVIVINKVILIIIIIIIVIIIIIIIITEYVVPHLQRAGTKRHYSVTRVDEELKAILKKEFVEHVQKSFYRRRREHFC